MTDPIEGRFGALISSGWIATTPDTGQDGAFILLTTADARAPHTMPLIAEALGLNPARGAFTQQVPAETRVTLETHGSQTWATLHAPGGVTPSVRPVPPEWAHLARKYRRVIVVIGYLPSRQDEDADDYTSRALQGARLAFGIVPLNP